MSAFVHDAAHIDACVMALTETPDKMRRELMPDSVRALDTDALGKALIDANVASVLGRYGDSIDADEYLGYAALREHYVYKRPSWLADLPERKRLATFGVALSSLDYQSCEIDTWQDSDVGMAVRNMTEALVTPNFEYAHPDGWSIQARD